ncbi:MAG: hypothetical protein ACTSPN_13235 [Promethearchaeota archaeon]
MCTSVSKDRNIQINWFGIRLRGRGVKNLYMFSVIGLNVTFLSLLFIILGLYSDLQYVDYVADQVGWETSVFFMIGYYSLYFVLIIVLIIFFMYNIRLVSKTRR